MPSDNKFIGKINLQGIIIDEATGKEVGLDMTAVNAIKADADAVYKKAEGYLEELYVAGIRKRPKTLEQVSAEQTQFNVEVLSTLKELRQEIQSLKNGEVVIV